MNTLWKRTFAAGLGININKSPFGVFISLKLNQIDATTLQIGNVTSVSRDFVIDGNSIDFISTFWMYVVVVILTFSHFLDIEFSINSSGNITGV
jgi:hypothetical protein